MKYIAFAMAELNRAALALREDGAVYIIEWQRDFTEPRVQLYVKLPNEEPPDSAAV